MVASPRACLGTIAALLLLGGPSDAATRKEAASLPPALAILQAELQRFSWCEDPIVGGQADWWGFWWSLPEAGCGDCEDFAAYSYARLRDLGVPAEDLRLEGAQVADATLADGGQARVLHVWLEADIGGRTWTIWNRQVRAGAWRERPLLSQAQMTELVETRFGPNWPYGIDVD